jgi:hypothetical protein
VVPSDSPFMKGYVAARLRALGALTAVALAFLAVGASAASAELIRFSFDDGRINLGQFKGERLIDGSEAGEPIAQLIGPIDPATGEFTAPAEGLFVPPKRFEDVEVAGFAVDVVAELTAAGPISGNFNVATGILDTRVLDATATLSAYQADSGPSAVLLARCVVSPVSVPVDTTGSLVDDRDPLNPVAYDANPFDIQGAAVGSWESLPPSVAAAGPFASVACPLIDEMAGGPGGIWLSGIADLTADPPSSTPPPAVGPGDGAKPRRCKKGRKRVRGKCVKRGKRR